MNNWENINRLSCIVTIATPLVTFALGLKFNKLKKWFQYTKIKRNIGKNSAVLIINIGKNDIENQVKLWLNQRKNYKNIPNEYILTVEKKGNIMGRDIDDIINDLKDKKIKLQQKGVYRIHLFISAPVSIATMIGAELSNNFDVLVYNHNFTSEDKYELWGKLQR